jgi:putative DNA primase/helicase
MSERSRTIDHAQALLYHARTATPFCSEDGEPCASIPSTIDSRRVVALRSSSFRDWLTANFYSEYETAPSTTALRAVLRTLEARARYGEVPAQKVERRISFEGDPFTPSRIVLDLANANGEVVEISSHGWQITGNLNHPFHQSPTMLPLPNPDPSPLLNKPLEHFAGLFRLTGENRVRVFSWLAAALRLIGPYPILVITGPAGSGKSVLARALRTLIDPSAAPLRRLPSRDNELRHLALQNWILAFDQVYRISRNVSEAICAISSGDAMEIAPADRDPLVLQLARPVILISSTVRTDIAWTPPRSFSNRTLAVELPTVATVLPEASLWSHFESLRPALVATLSTAIATALRRIREIDLGNVARFPDSAAWAAAAAPTLGIEETSIAGAFTGSSSIWTGSDMLRRAVQMLLIDDQCWSGSATELLSRLRTVVAPEELPATPKGLSQALQRVPGIRVVRERDTRGERILTIKEETDTSAKTARN